MSFVEEAVLCATLDPLGSALNLLLNRMSPHTGSRKTMFKLPLKSRPHRKRKEVTRFATHHISSSKMGCGPRREAAQFPSPTPEIKGPPLASSCQISWLPHAPHEFFSCSSAIQPPFRLQISHEACCLFLVKAVCCG